MEHRACGAANPGARQEIGLPVHLLARWYDVDDTATLRRLFAELLEGAQSARN